MLSHSHLISYHIFSCHNWSGSKSSLHVNTNQYNTLLTPHKYYCPESTDANPNECRKYCWLSRVLSIISYIDWFRSMRYLVRNDLHLLPRGGFRNVKKKGATAEANPTIKLVKARSKQWSESQANWESEAHMRSSHRQWRENRSSGLSVLHPENPPESATPIVVDHWAHPIALDKKPSDTNPWRPTYIPSITSSCENSWNIKITGFFLSASLLGEKGHRLLATCFSQWLLTESSASSALFRVVGARGSQGTDHEKLTAINTIDESCPVLSIWWMDTSDGLI